MMTDGADGGAPRITAIGDRSIAAQTLIAQIVNTGDHARFFVGNYETLAEAYIEPWPVFDRVHLERFTGRAWLRQELDEFMARESSGYFILEAPAGLGKTTFLADLVRERGCVHHFTELAKDTGVALKNMAAQLVRAYELVPFSVDDVLPTTAARRPDFFATLLRRTATDPDRRPILLVVDAIDEADTPPDQNALGLPPVLPTGVFIVVSKRPVDVPLRTTSPRKICRLLPEGDQNLADMAAYLERAAEFEGVAAALAERSYRADQFVDALLTASRGVWVYLHYVVGEIERGERRPLELSMLPHGLWQYYADFWGRWRARRSVSEWTALDLPVLTTLAALQEPASDTLLVALTGVPQSDAIDLLERRWAAFITGTGTDLARRYRVYHQSVGDFAAGHVDLSELDSADQVLARELARATVAAHDRIARRYLDAWGGLENGLPQVSDTAHLGMDDSYGARNVVHHLAESAPIRTDPLAPLEALLTLERESAQASVVSEPVRRRRWFRRVVQQPETPVPATRVENLWYAIRQESQEVEGYMRDVASVRLVAEGLSADTIQAEGTAAGLAMEVRCALSSASSRQHFASLPGALLARLVEAGTLTLSAAKAAARQAPKVDHRVRALLDIASVVPEASRTQLLAEVLHEVQRLDNDWSRARWLERAVPQLGESQLEATLALTRALTEPGARAQALAALAAHSREDESAALWREAFEQATRIEHEWPRRERMRDLMAIAPEADLAKVVTTLRDEPDALARWEIVGAIGHRLRGALLREALELTDNEQWRANLIATLAEHVDEADAATLREVASDIADPSAKAKAVAALATRRPAELAPAVLQTLRDCLGPPPDRDAIEDRLAWYFRQVGAAESLAVLAPLLTAPLTATALDVALSFQHPTALRNGLAGLAPVLPGPEIERALRTISQIKDRDLRARLSAILIPRLDADVRPDRVEAALPAVEAIANPGDRADALLWLLPALPPHSRPRAVSGVLSATAASDPLSAALERLRDAAETIPPERGPEAVGLASRAPDPSSAGSYVVELAQAFPSGIAAALNVALQIGDVVPRLSAVKGLAPLLDESLARRAFTAIRDTAEMRDAGVLWISLEALAALAPVLPSDSRLELLTALRIDDNERTFITDDMLDAEQAIVATLPTESLTAAADLYRSIGDGAERAYALLALASELSGERREAVVDNAHTLLRGSVNAATLAKAVAEQLRRHRRAPPRGERSVDPLAAEALAILDELHDPELVLAMLGAVVFHLPPNEAEDLVQQRLDLTRILRTEALDSIALMSVVRFLNAEQVDSLFSWWSESRDHTRRERFLTDLAPRLTPQQLEEALSIVREGEDPGPRARMLRTLAYFDHDLAPDALEAAHDVPDPAERALLLTSLHSTAMPPDRPSVLDDVLAAIQQIDYEDTRGRMLVSLMREIEALPDAGHTNRICRLALDLQAPEARAAALVAVAHALSDVRRDDLLCEAQRSVSVIKEEKTRLDALAVLTALPYEWSGKGEATAAFEQLARDRGEPLRIVAVRQATAAQAAKPPPAMGPRPAPPPVVLYSIVRDRLLSSLLPKRSELLQAIVDVAGNFDAAGGAATASRVAAAVEDAGRWWP